jgi:hypothetical protein
MIPVPAGVRVFLATGHTDMRKGFDGLALAVQEHLKMDAHAGQIYVFRGKRGDLIKVLPEGRQRGQDFKRTACVSASWQVPLSLAAGA